MRKLQKKVRALMKTKLTNFLAPEKTEASVKIENEVADQAA